MELPYYLAALSAIGISISSLLVSLLLVARQDRYVKELKELKEIIKNYDISKEQCISE